MSEKKQISQVNTGIFFSKNIRIFIYLPLCLIPLLFSACSGSVPRRPENLCAVFREKPEWFTAARISLKRWGVPIPVMMAIMYKESGFRPRAKPPRKTCFFIFPGPRLSSAYGYAQAIDSTWDIYRKSAGKTGADREDFDDAIDFIGWYCHISHKKCGISKKDSYRLYLAYHEGQTGYNRGSYKKKKWLQEKARLLKKQSDRYTKQLNSCIRELETVTGKSCLYPF
ncbi:MAG: transglycosylase SLT domain-containing protein [Desulfococcaceae bacterium]|nr:transglycosylase SLT domain-containing protein [Desulfococcaceae bacterium]